MISEPHFSKTASFGPSDLSRDARNFWGEVAPSEHLVQIYKDDEVFIDSLEGFVAGGIGKGDGIIVIAIPRHLAALEHRLLQRGIDPLKLNESGQYLVMDASQALGQFMIPNVLGDGKSWPDERRFIAFVNDLVGRCGTRPDGTKRRVRAFGEMVALLWAQGNASATVRLETLWHEFCKMSALCLFCAYPRAYFTEEPEKSIREICELHSRVVGGR